MTRVAPSVVNENGKCTTFPLATFGAIAVRPDRQKTVHNNRGIRDSSMQSGLSKTHDSSLGKLLARAAMLTVLHVLYWILAVYVPYM